MKQVFTIQKYFPNKNKPSTTDSPIVATFETLVNRSHTRLSTQVSQLLRIRKQDSLFLLETFSRSVKDWIVLAEHRTEKAAVNDMAYF